MIFIIRSDGEAAKRFIEKIHTLVGPSKVAYFTSCAEYELEFIKKNGVNPAKLTVIEVHPGLSIESIVKYAKIFEDRFNLPIFLGRVEDLWQ
tara:strand:- start:5 stop:280 length:276 start_codon:yes stop_codon:yes gene_type:complete